MLLKMTNGGIINILNDREYYSGSCDTCDYDSIYVNNYYIKLTTVSIHIEATQKGEYPLSDANMMRIILPNVDEIKNMTENEFVEWLKIKVEKEVPNGLKVNIN